jgi:hypothetical protein
LGEAINYQVEITIIDELTTNRQFNLSGATPETQNAYNNLSTASPFFNKALKI